MFSPLFGLLKKDFKWHEHVRSALFGLVLALIVTLPFVMMLVNLMLLYLRFVYVYLILINLCVTGLFMLAAYLYARTLTYYNKNSPLCPRRVMLVIGGVFGALSFIVGIILIMVITPQFI